MSPGRNFLIYDGECPFCSRFVRLARLRDTIGELRLIDAREDGIEVRAAREAGLVIDNGMVLSLNGELFHGADCLNRLALLSSRSGAFNRINHFLFRTPVVASISYPLLKAGRNLTIKLLGISPLGY